MLGQRIKQARLASGLSQRALAKRAGVSAMAISKYEREKATPSSRVLLALAQALALRTEYFFRPETVELKETEYRKHVRLPKKVLARIGGDVIEQVERLMELERFIPSTPISGFDIPTEIPQRVTDLEELEDVTIALREHWKLGLNPIPDLTDTLEEHAIIVLQTSAHGEHRFDGLVAIVDSLPVIVVGADWPGDRQRFTLAHELGHLLLRGRLTAEVDEERAANRFAGAFLAPKSLVFRELGARRRRLEPRELWILKNIYGLSMGGWLHRANDLGILRDVHYREMVKRFRARGWHRTEPWDQYPKEKPKLFDQLVYRALAEELISESKAAELLGYALHEFRRGGSTDTEAIA
jgi:Zn-dependent peptidase ImmA (M78 family)/transcriptional regulator with XRE-family HTH domain